MVECKGCRALEFVSSGIKRGKILNIKYSDPIYNCCFENKIVLIDNKPCCKNCTEKTTRVRRASSERIK